jgi:Ca-activated chloride channel homolog
MTVARLALIALLILLLPGHAPALTAAPSSQSPTADLGTLKLTPKERAQKIARLDDGPKEFFELASPIMPESERDAFLLLESPEDRAGAIQSFWRARGGKDFEKWKRDYRFRVIEARNMFNDLEGERAQMYLLHGRPSAMEPVPCGHYFLPTELWTFARIGDLDPDVTLLFYQPQKKSDFVLLRREPDESEALEYRLLSPEGRAVGPVPVFVGIPERPGGERRPLALSCPGGEGLLRALDLAKRSGPQLAALLDRSLLPEAPAEEDRSTPRLAARAGDGSVPFRTSVRYPGKRGGRTATELRIELDPAALSATTVEDRQVYRLQVEGEVSGGTRIIDTFRYDYELPAREQGPATIIIERFLPPHDYEVTLHVTDLTSGSEGLATAAIEVPYLSPRETDPLRGDRVALVVEMEQDFRIGTSSLRLVPLGPGFFTGKQRFETIVTGDQIRTVEFFAENQKLISRRQPPYTVDVDLGPIPLPKRIRVVGLSADGRIVAGDELVANAGSDPYRVRIVSPRVSERLSGDVRVEVVAHVPTGRKLESLQLFLNDELVATGYETVLIHTVPLPDDPRRISYLRALATIDDAAASHAEDTVLINAPELLEEVDVRLVELPTTVIHRGRVIDDLSSGAFSVLDQGEPVAIEKFEYVRDLPLSIGMAVDASGSMRTRMTQALQTGARFFERVLRPGDRAFIVAFEDEPWLVQEWTDSLANLTAALSSLEAGNMTALYDAVIHSLYNFQGLQGQKALVVLSDGQDTVSAFTFDQALEYARRSGIPIYTIGVGIPRDDIETRAKLKRLSDETGADSYFIDVVGGLAGIYERIERELRSQYILGFYPSAAARESGAWRKIEVRVQQGSAKTIRGYYP